MHASTAARVNHPSINLPTIKKETAYYLKVLIVSDISRSVGLMQAIMVVRPSPCKASEKKVTL